MSALKILPTVPVQGFLDAPKQSEGIVYGPFENGHYGKNLGVNILGEQKMCSFDCPYCDLGATAMRLNRLKTDAKFPSLEEVGQAVLTAFKKIHTQGGGVDAICLSGNGEPTLHPEFPELARSIVEIRNSWMPGRPIHLFTNGVGLDTRRIADAVNMLDERFVKLDAGNEKLFKIVNSPLSRTNLARVLTGIRKMRDVTIQSLFFEGSMTNTSPTDIDDWLEVIAMIKPKAVHINGLTRVPAVSTLKRCDQDTLYAIASRLERKTQIRAIVTP